MDFKPTHTIELENGQQVEVMIKETTWDEIALQVLVGDIRDFQMLEFIDEKADNYYKKIL